MLRVARWRGKGGVCLGGETAPLPGWNGLRVGWLGAASASKWLRMGDAGRVGTVPGGPCRWGWRR
jgi:hypothetical protein